MRWRSISESIDDQKASLFQFRQILRGFLLELRRAALAAELQRLSLIDVFEGFAHFSQSFAGDDAFLCRRGGLGGFGLRGLAGNEEQRGEGGGDDGGFHDVMFVSEENDRGWTGIAEAFLS